MNPNIVSYHAQLRPVQNWSAVYFFQDDIRFTSYANLVKSARLSSGHRYRYVFKTPFNSSIPTLLFLHGWPETSYSWVNQIEYFTRHGYGIVAPDMLGTGGTDNPEDLESFTFKRTASEMVELLECEGVGRVVGVGHDMYVTPWRACNIPSPSNN